nr:ankyrin repeat domain-containing protein [Actinomadura citrea]
MLHLLDPGADPHVIGDRRRTSAHTLRHLGDEGLLARLLGAGLDIDARDREQRTPLFAAICGNGSVALVRALLAAGARIDVTGEIHGEDVSLLWLIRWLNRDPDALDFIVERIEREHPEIAEEE